MLLEELFENTGMNSAFLNVLRANPGIMFKEMDGTLQLIGEYPDLDEWHQKHFENKWDVDSFSIN